VKVRVLGAYGGELGPYRNSAYLFDNGVLLDAGGASSALDIDEVRAIKAIVLTHAHADHIASLPFLLDVRIGCGALEVYALRETIATLRVHMFNNKIWPDFERIPDPRNPLLRFHELERERPLDLEGLRFLPVPVDHTVPTVGFVISDSRSSIVFSGDTGPTRRIWELAVKADNLRAALIEVSFPERLDKISVMSKHLSTASVRDEIEKLPPDLPIVLYHLKPAFIGEIAAELSPLISLRRGVKIIEQDRTYDFASATFGPVRRPQPATVEE